ncbi:MAG: hypothetical protein AAB267_09780, partial [Candidatus Desantisbacteria bacterium]
MGSGYWYDTNPINVNVSFGTCGIYPGDCDNTNQPNGTFSTTFRVNTQPYGSTVITTKDLSSGDITTTVFFIQPESISINPTFAQVGQMVSVWGGGWKGTETIHISFGTHKTITSVVASTNGTFSTSFRVNTQVGGTTQITAYGTSTGINITTEFNIRSKIITLTPLSGYVGDFVTIIANGCRQATVTISFGTTETITTAIGGTSGTFSISFRINTQKYGTKVITINDGNSSDTTTFFIQARITVVNPSQGTVSTLVTVEGTGFGSSTGGTEPLSIDFGTHISITTTVATEHGTFSVTFIVNTQANNAEPNGTTTVIRAVRLYDPDPDTYIFEILPDIISFAETQGTVGTIVTIIGNGYGYQGEARTVRIHFGTQQSITTTTITANIGGTFSITFVIGSQSVGTKVITAIDFDGDLDTTTFQILPEIIYFAPNTGSVGTTITIKGTGFNGSATVRIDFGTHKTITTTLSSSNGTFSLTFRVNTQSWGTKVITVSTSVDAQLTTNFIITGAYFTMVNPTQGSVTTEITVQGVGFNASQTVTIDFGT